MLGFSYKQLALIAALSVVVVYASNNRLPVLGNNIRSAIGG